MAAKITSQVQRSRFTIHCHCPTLNRWSLYYDEPKSMSLHLFWTSYDSKISNRIISTNRIPNRKFDSNSNRISKLRRSL